jgi:branched-chain amino acid transport system permease protein
MGGVIFALANTSVQPDNYGTQLTFLAYTALILGGAARVFSPVVGSMLLWFLIAFTDTAVRQAVRAGYIPEAIMTENQAGQVRFMLIGLVLMLLMIFRPQGIFGNRREIALERR